MWLKPPNSWRDGLIGATLFSLTVAAIFSITSTSDETNHRSSQCQEVVVDVEKKGNILARCPTGTYIDIVDNNVICRCGVRRTVESLEREPDELVFPPLEITPNPVPRLPRDDKSIDI